MSKVLVGSHEMDIDLFVFDKDGLLFESLPFWKELANARIDACSKYLLAEQLREWLRVLGVSYVSEDTLPRATGINPSGVFAVASPREEILVTAAFLAEHLGIGWVEAREQGEQIFEDADRYLDLKAALVPRAGFPRIFERLRLAHIPYGIATSDTYDRAWRSVAIFDDPKALRFIVTPMDVRHGKPAPEMLRLICEKTGVPPERIAMVGDSFVDMEMASRAGAIGIGIPEQDENMRRKMKIHTPYLIDSLEEIHPILYGADENGKEGHSCI